MPGSQKTENYLRAILKYQILNGSARGIDVAAELDVSRPTVCITFKALNKAGYIDFCEDSSVTLTEKGMEIAKQMTEKYNFFYDFLKYLSVSNDTAREEACKLEHCMSDESFRALKEFFINYLTQSNIMR